MEAEGLREEDLIIILAVAVTEDMIEEAAEVSQGIIEKIGILGLVRALAIEKIGGDVSTVR